MLRPAPPCTRSDVTVAAAVWLLAAGTLAAVAALADLDPETAGLGPGLGTAPWWLGLAVVTAQAVAVPWRLVQPAAVLWGVAAGVPLAALAGVGDAVSSASFAVLVAAYTLAASRTARQGATALVGAAVLVAVGTVLARGEPLSGLTLAAGAAQGVATVGAAAGVGVVVRTRREVADARAARIEALSREQGARVEAALARERAAMARELHDIAAHHLSGIAVMTGAIGRQIDVDPDGAKRAVAQVREQSTAMLRDLRNLVVLLRDEGPAEVDGEVRMETLAGVADLVARARATGQDVTLSETGPVADVATSGAVGPLAQLATYRVVQEALSNAARHAPGARCDVRVDAGTPDRVEVEVRNGPRAPGLDPGPHEPGYGLVGMRERAELTGATLRYGPTGDGGWQVRMVVPVAPVTREESR